MQQPGEKVFKNCYQVVSVNFVGMNKNKTSNKLKKVISKIGITTMLLLQNLCWFCFLFSVDKSIYIGICDRLPFLGRYLCDIFKYFSPEMLFMFYRGQKCNMFHVFQKRLFGMYKCNL